MNRRKKARAILLKKNKKASAKSGSKSKPRYISKAERAKLVEESSSDTTNNSK